MAASMTTTRKKRVSKKTKRSWRKNTDVQDVDDFLEAKRVEAIKGGPISAKKNEDLFTIDTKAVKIKETNLFRTRKERARAKPLRCFAGLDNESSIPDPVGKRQRKILPGEAKGILRVRKVQATVKRLKKEAKSLNDSSQYTQRVSQRNKEKIASLDIWGTEDTSGKLPINEDWLRPQTLVHNRENFTKKIGKKTKFSRVKNSNMPAVEAPHPGESYNPNLEDHQDLLQKIVEKEKAIIKHEKHIERVTTHMFCKKEDMPTEASKLRELAEGLPVEGEPVVDDDLSDSEYKALNPPVLNKKKNQKKRRNLKEAREEERKKFAAKLEKKKIADIYRLKFLEEEMSAEKIETAKIKELKNKALEKKALLPKKMSRFNFEAPELAFNMPTEIKGSVRKLKSEGSILADRFKSMQKRNVIETRVRQKIKRKYRPKKFVKTSHKIETD